MHTALMVDLGRMRYAEAWDWQRTAAELVRRGDIPDTVFVVEHPPVYTVGRSAHGSLDNLLWDGAERERRGIELYQVDRGGDITYHGPGQLVLYPILDLNRHGRDLHRYLRNLEEIVIRVLARYDIAAGRLPPHTGVWVEEEKICAIGVKAGHWITQHGLALNVDPDLDHFTGIIPCGIRDKAVTSMSRILGRSLGLDDVSPRVFEELSAVLQIDPTPVSLDFIRQAARESSPISRPAIENR